MKVLVATDGSEAAIDGARSALTLLRDGADISLVMVVPELEDPMATAGGFQGPTLTEAEAQASFASDVEAGQAAIRRTADALARAALSMSDSIEPRLITSDVDAGTAIVEEAERVGADLVVIGSSGKGTFRRLLSGSVSETIVRHAPCPVLVVRHQAD